MQQRKVGSRFVLLFLGTNKERAAFEELGQEDGEAAKWVNMRPAFLGTCLM